MDITRFFLSCFLIVLALTCCCSATAASDGKGGEKNNQMATFNISALSAQVIASTQEKKEVKEETTEEDITQTPAYRLFTLQRDTARYVESVGGEGYVGSLLDFISIDADTTCYFCIPRSQRPSGGWQVNEE
jgi:hypothetical protein